MSDGMIEIEVAGSTSNTSHSDQTTNVSKERADAPVFRPRLQNRRCGVMFIETLMPDGRTSRILQVLDSPVDFSAHPDFVEQLNVLRKKYFGEKAAFYVTKDAPIPEENPEICVFFAFIGTKNGRVSGEKVFTKDEARLHLKKLREEIDAHRSSRRAAPDFGSPFQEAFRRASETPRRAAAGGE